jgi:hypothetical protein
MEVSGQLHTPAALTPRKQPLVPIVQEAGSTQSWSAYCEEEKNLSQLQGIEP